MKKASINTARKGNKLHEVASRNLERLLNTSYAEIMNAVAGLGTGHTSIVTCVFDMDFLRIFFDKNAFAVINNFSRSKSLVMNVEYSDYIDLLDRLSLKKDELIQFVTEPHPDDVSHIALFTEQGTAVFQCYKSKARASLD